MKETIAPSPAALGQALRLSRAEHHLTQRETGEKVGIDQATISGVENGNPGTRLDTLFHLLAALDLELVVRSRKGAGAASAKARW